MIKFFLGFLTLLGLGHSFAQDRVVPLIPEGQYVESRSVPIDRSTITYSVECTSVKCFYHIATIWNNQNTSMQTSIKPLEVEVANRVNDSIKSSFELVNDPRSTFLRSELKNRPEVDRCFRVGFFYKEIGYLCTLNDQNDQVLLFFSQTKRESACWNDICFNGKLVRIRNE